jgi:hypothetical protein
MYMWGEKGKDKGETTFLSMWGEVRRKGIRTEEEENLQSPCVSSTCFFSLCCRSTWWAEHCSPLFINHMTAETFFITSLL